jgi:bifunctional non-homologous end joining protein LigD
MIIRKDLLKVYNRKRNFKITKEPSGKKKALKKNKKLSFVIQEHHARRLHYDFRLEWEGVLKSWAVPKGPSSDPGEKRLAVQTEDHPLEYGKFHGTIPQGEYGAGEVFIWDKGTWEPIGDPEAGMKKGHLEFKLNGGKLQGNWMLIRTHYKGREDKKNWLLIKRSDEKKRNLSDPWPDFIAPQLPRLVTSVPDESEWIHEMKFDGYRIQGHIKNGIAHLYTRNALDWSNSFPHILKGLGRLKCEDAIMDGEIVALDEDGRTHFQRLQNSLKSKNDLGLRYYVFDIMYLNGQDLRALPLLERKEILKQLLKNAGEHILYSDHFLDGGVEFYQLSCDHHLEGIVSKLADSPYRSGRSDLWTKTKCTLRQEFVIGGWTDAQGGRSGFGALLLGVYEEGKLRYAGRVGTGFDLQTLRYMRKMLSGLEVEESPFELNSPKGKNLHWVKPKNVCEVSFTQWTDEGFLRTPVFMGIRKDKPAADVSKEKIQSPSKKNATISSPDKILFKKEKVTKLQVHEFYQSIASVMLPYLADRPISLVRCPQGSEGTCFYQKHITGKVPESFTTFPIKESKASEIYISINSAQGLRDLVQLNAFEIHAWNCHYESVLTPDQIVMDFDPGPGVPWKEVVNAAIELKAILDDLGLKSFVKLTGGKGLHVHIPIAPLYDWDQVKSFTQALALQMVSHNPQKYVASMSKKIRKGKIFLDYFRNEYGATAVVPYSLRAKPLSAVALPLDWKELKRLKGPQEYTLDKALKKIKSRKVDPWKGILKLKQKISILESVQTKKAA